MKKTSFILQSIDFTRLIILSLFDEKKQVLFYNPLFSPETYNYE